MSKQYNFLEKYPVQSIFEVNDDDFLNTIDCDEVVNAHLDYHVPNVAEMVFLDYNKLEQELKLMREI